MTAPAGSDKHAKFLTLNPFEEKEPSIIFIALFFVPIEEFKTETASSVYQYNLSGIEKMDAQGISSLGTIPIISVLAVIIGLVAFSSIFLYKKRMLQLKMGQLNLFLITVFIALLFFYVEHYLKTMTHASLLQMDYRIGIYFPLAALILIILASKAIKKDEELVRSADRLR